MDVEMCIECDNPTGKAGACEDSLYVGDDGPFCETCFERRDAMTWLDMGEQRDAEGNLTDLALALNAISDVGCDCGTDEVGSCVGCLCEQALKGLWEQLDSAKAEVERLTKMLDVCAVTHDHNVKLKAEVERLKAEHAKWDNELLKELFTWADNWLSDEAKDQGARAVLQRIRSALAGS